MNSDQGISPASDLPFWVPCPPPALRLPPPIYTVTPKIKENAAKSIPSPPSGARFPGDRLKWKPLVFLKTKLQKALELDAAQTEMADQSDIAQKEADLHTPGDILDMLRDGLEPPVVGKTPTVNIEEADLVAELDDESSGLPEPDATEKLAEAADQDTCDVIYLGCTENEPVIVTASSSPVEVGIKSAEIPPQREIRMDCESVQISELAALLGIRGYEILGDLLGMGIFAKTSDEINVDTAKEVAEIHGADIRFVEPSGTSEDPVNSSEVLFPDSSNKTTFKIKTGAEVSDGDWVRDSVHGLGRILKLYSSPGMPDRHRVWFVGNTEEGTIINNHPLRPDTLGVIDTSMVPPDIRDAAPEIG